MINIYAGKYEERKTNEILKIAEECYDLNLNDNAQEIELPTFADFYQAVSVTVEYFPFFNIPIFYLLYIYI